MGDVRGFDHSLIRYVEARYVPKNHSQNALKMERQEVRESDVRGDVGHDRKMKHTDSRYRIIV